MVSVNDNLRAGNLAREAVELVDAGHKEVCSICWLPDYFMGFK